MTKHDDDRFLFPDDPPEFAKKILRGIVLSLGSAASVAMFYGFAKAGIKLNEKANGDIRTSWAAAQAAEDLHAIRALLEAPPRGAAARARARLRDVLTPEQAEAATRGARDAADFHSRLTAASAKAAEAACAESVRKWEDCIQ